MVFEFTIKPIHSFIIISVSSDPLNVEIVERKVKITKSWISWKWKEFFRWNKNHKNLLAKYKKIENTSFKFDNSSVKSVGYHFVGAFQ